MDDRPDPNVTRLPPDSGGRPPGAVADLSEPGSLTAAHNAMRDSVITQVGSRGWFTKVPSAAKSDAPERISDVLPTSASTEHRRRLLENPGNGAHIVQFYEDEEFLADTVTQYIGSGLLAGEGHIPLACTPEPASAAPVTGAVDDCEVEFEHRMEVRRIYESPRVTKPYTDGEWTAIADLGHFDGEQFLHQIRVCARKNDHDLLTLLLHFNDISTDTIAGAVLFVENLLLARNDAFGAAEVDDGGALVEALHGAVDQGVDFGFVI